MLVVRPSSEYTVFISNCLPEQLHSSAYTSKQTWRTDWLIDLLACHEGSIAVQKTRHKKKETGATFSRKSTTKTRWEMKNSCLFGAVEVRRHTSDCHSLSFLRSLFFALLNHTLGFYISILHNIKVFSFWMIIVIIQPVYRLANSEPQPLLLKSILRSW